MRKPFLAGNWKMNKLQSDVTGFFEQFVTQVESCKNCDVLLAAPYLSLKTALDCTANSDIWIASQNVHWEQSGAYTGEVSAAMLSDVGVKFAIIGHSERRQYFAETNETVNLRTKAALSAGLHPIVCVGETLEEREAEKTNDIVKTQLLSALEGVDALDGLTLAYEPVWAIGTGKTASPEQAQQVHSMIRSTLVERFSKDQASHVRLLYGGSAKPENIKELLGQEDIDGGLVGGASLDAASFAKMVQMS